MSFVTKMCTSIVRNGVKILSTNAAMKSVTSVREFHMMMKPLPKSLADLSSTLNPISSSFMSPPSMAAGPQRLLTPIYSLINQVAGFKVKGRLKRRCKDCYFVVRQQRLYVICPTYPRHKQMSMKKREYKSWILTHATQSKVRPF